MTARIRLLISLAIACVTFPSVTLGIVYAEKTCMTNTACGTASAACNPGLLGGNCTYCDGLTVGNWCKYLLTGTCNSPGGAECGVRLGGTCDKINHRCSGTIPISDPCMHFTC